VPHSSQSPLVDTAWLADRLDAPGLVILDGTWHLPTAGRDARAEYEAEHIPGALFFDIDGEGDATSDLPHMLPSTIQFASRMKKMGIGDGMKVVVYDTHGLFSAPRVWWTFRAMGHTDVAVLDGGLRKWTAEGRAVTDAPSARRFERHFTPRLNAGLVRDLAEMRALLDGGRAQIVDARPVGRFEGRDPEPRPGLRLGHIPGSCNVPFGELVNADGTLKSRDDLIAVFRAAGIDPHAPVVTTCGSGITASLAAFALAVVGQPDVAVYDGSWAEWGRPGDTPVASGTGGASSA
jgi:thiosulfate/3-mercaptopyruvate sulfurtransferase